LGSHTGSEAQLDLATVRYHALGAYAKSVYLVCAFNVFHKESKVLSKARAVKSSFIAHRPALADGTISSLTLLTALREVLAWGAADVLS